MQDKNKRIFITGANGGMGYEVIKELLEMGFTNITLAARTTKKAEEAKSRLKSVGYDVNNIIAVGGFDMVEHEGIKSSVHGMESREKYDIVFLQAGGVFFTEDYQYWEKSGQKIEKTVYQNAIGGYLTYKALLDNDLVNENARVVFAGGEGARGIKGLIDKPEFKDAQEFENYVFGKSELPKYNPMNAIGVSKLGSALLVQKLASNNDGKEYIWFSPGLTHGTNGLKTVSPFKRFFMEKIMFGITGLFGLSQSPKKGAQKYIKSLLGELGTSGDVLGAPEGKAMGLIQDQKPMNSAMTNPEIIESFWKIVNKVETIK